MVYYVLPQSLAFSHINAHGHASYPTRAEAVRAADTLYEKGYGHQIVWAVSAAYTTQSLAEAMKEGV